MKKLTTLLVTLSLVTLMSDAFAARKKKKARKNKAQHAHVTEGKKAQAPGTKTATNRKARAPRTIQ